MGDKLKNEEENSPASDQDTGSAKPQEKEVRLI